MIKKKFCVNLNILYGLLYGVLCLLVLNVLSTTSYALTENGFKNLMYNYASNQLEYTDSQAKTYVTTAFENCSDMHQYMNDNYLWCVFRDSGVIRFFIEPSSNYGTQRNFKTEAYWSGRNPALQLYPVCYHGAYFQLYETNLGYSTNSPTVMNKAHYGIGIQDNLRLYSEQNIYETDLTNIMYQAPYSSPSWFTSSGSYDVNFAYVYNPNFQNVTVQDLLAQDVQMKAITYADFYYDKDYLCVFGDFDQLDHVYLAYYKYNRYSGQWEPYQWVSPYTNYEKEDNQIRLYFNGNYVANTIICLGFIPKTDDFYSQYAWFYLTGKNTSSAGGVISPTSYSGDNDVQQQINDNNLQEIKDTLTDDSQVDNMLSEFGSGDINTMASKFGLPSIPNPFSQFIETIFYGITDVLTLDGDVTLDFGFQGQHLYLKSSDFTTPLNVVTVFLSSFLTFIYVYYMIELGYRTLINIREFNLDKTGIGNHYGQAGDGLQVDGSWRLL